MKKSRKDQIAPGVLAALDGAERLSLPLLQSVEANRALRVAREAVDPNVYPHSTQEEVSAAITAFNTALTHDSLDRMRTERCGELIAGACGSALLFVAENYEGAQESAAFVRREINRRDKKAAERAAEQERILFQEAFWETCRLMQAGQKPHKLACGHVGEDDYREIEVIAMTRACGGIVLVDNQPHFAHEWIDHAMRSHDPYIQGLARRVQEAISDANELKHVSRRD